MARQRSQHLDLLVPGNLPNRIVRLHQGREHANLQRAIGNPFCNHALKVGYSNFRKCNISTDDIDHHAWGHPSVGHLSRSSQYVLPQG